MADGDLAYSHVPADDGRLLCADYGLGGVALVRRRTRRYWRMRILWSYDYFDPEAIGPSGYWDDSELAVNPVEVNSNMAPGAKNRAVRDGYGRYHLDFHFVTGDANPPFDFTALSGPAGIFELSNFRLNIENGDYGTPGVGVEILDSYGHNLYSISYYQGSGHQAVVTPTTIHGVRDAYGYISVTVDVSFTLLPHHPECPHQ